MVVILPSHRFPIVIVGAGWETSVPVQAAIFIRWIAPAYQSRTIINHDY
jgi:hypothetical protein